MASLNNALLCLHGSGSSANIFRLQLAKFRMALKDKFEFVCIDAPYPASAGPGILPLFAGAGPFYSWFGGQEATVDERLNSMNAAVKAAIHKWQSSKGDAKA